jgi:hypothetical protein
MNNQSSLSGPASYRRAAIVITGSTLFVFLALAMHPQVSNPHSVSDIVNQVASHAMHDEFVHGFTILLLAAIAGGFSIFSDVLGAQRGSVRFGKTAYLVGYGAMTAAMLFDGFVTPIFAQLYANANPVDTQTVFLILSAIGVFIQVLTKAGIIAMSAAFIAWAYALHSHAKFSAWPAKLVWVGYAAGIISIGVILFFSVVLGPYSLIAIFAVHAIWNFGVAAILTHATKAIE